MKKIIFILSFCACFVFTGLAQVKNQEVRVYPDSIVSPNDSLAKGTMISNVPQAQADSVKTEVVGDEKFKPDPMKAIWMGAIIPGYGHVVTKKYWHLPLVYGGYLGFAYAITWNNSRYTSYKNAYRDILVDDPMNPVLTSYMDILPKGYTIEMLGGRSTYTQHLKTASDGFRRYRDLSIILAVAYHAVVMLWAYVDAELYNFDISPDLVMNVQPVRINREYNSPSAIGLQCSINF